MRKITRNSFETAPTEVHVLTVKNGRVHVHQRRRGMRLSRFDPSRTTITRRRFVVEMNRRFLKISRAIQELVVKDDAFGLSSTLVTMQEPQLWRFRTSADKVKAYRQWLQERIDTEVLSTDPVSGEPWTSTYVQSSYRKGVRRAYTDVNKTKLVDYEGTREEFLREAFGAPETLSKIELISTRVFEELRGVTAAMSQQMSRTLAEGLAAGKGPRFIARELRKNVANITKKRARVIARTEVIHAHAEGQLDSFEKLGVKEVGIMAEWSTAGDDRVCERCGALEGETMTVKEARGQIPLHPNCRCAWIPSTEKAKEVELGYKLPEALPETPEMKEMLAMEKSLALKTRELRKAYKAGDRSVRPTLMKTKEELRVVRAKIDAKALVPKPAVPKPPSKVLKKVLEPVEPIRAPKIPAPAGIADTKFATAEDYRQYLIQQVKAAQDPALMKQVKTLEVESKRVWKNWCNTYASDPNHAKWGRMGTELDSKLKVLRKQVKVSVDTQRKLLDEVSSKIGECELLADKAQHKIYDSVVNDILSWIPGRRSVTRQFDWVNLEHYSRASNSMSGSYRVSSRRISMWVKSKEIFAHEFGHHLGYQLRGFMQAQNQFFQKRTVGEKIVQLMRDVVGKKDKWKTYDVYAGRVYEGAAGARHPEVVSTGIQYLWKNPYKAATKDPEWFNMIVSQLKGIPTKPGVTLAKIGRRVTWEGSVGRVAKISKTSVGKLVKKEASLASRLKDVRKAYRAGNKGLRSSLLKLKDQLRVVQDAIDDAAKIVKIPKIIKPTKIIARPKMKTHAKDAYNKAQQKAWEKGLTTKEKKFLRKWVQGGDTYQELRYGLAGRKPPWTADIVRPMSLKDRKKAIATFRAAIDKSAQYEGKVYRALGFGSKKTVKKSFRVGKKIEFKFTQSGSRSSKVAETFLDNADDMDQLAVQLRIQSKTGTYLGNISMKDPSLGMHQEEVLLHAGTKYKIKTVKFIKDVDLQKGGYYVVDLVEIAA